MAQTTMKELWKFLYKLENKLHNRNCCKFARTRRQQVGQSELVYFEMKNMHYELKNQCNIQSMVCRSAKLADTHFALGPKNILKCVFYANLHEFYPKF